MTEVPVIVGAIDGDDHPCTRRVAIVVRSIMGHCTEEMTNLYSHVGIDEKRSMVNAVVGRIREKSGTPGGTPEPEKKKAEQ